MKLTAFINIPGYNKDKYPEFPFVPQITDTVIEHNGEKLTLAFVRGNTNRTDLESDNRANEELDLYYQINGSLETIMDFYTSRLIQTKEENFFALYLRYGYVALDVSSFGMVEIDIQRYDYREDEYVKHELTIPGELWYHDNMSLYSCPRLKFGVGKESKTIEIDLPSGHASKYLEFIQNVLNKLDIEKLSATE